MRKFKSRNKSVVYGALTEKHTSTRKDIPAFYQHLERVKTETIQRLRADEKRFGDAVLSAEEGINLLNERLVDVRGDIKKYADERGGARGNLTRLGVKEKALQGFVVSLEEESLRNLRSKIGELQGKLHANTDPVEVIQRDIEAHESKLKDLVRSHDNFALLVGTALKAHFSEAEIRDVFRVLNPSLLSTPLQAGSIEVENETSALKYLYTFKDAICDGVFEWGGTKIHLSSLPGSSEILHDLESIKAGRFQAPSANNAA